MEVNGANDAGRSVGPLLFYHQRVSDRCQLGSAENSRTVSEEASAPDLSRIHHCECCWCVSGGTDGGRFGTWEYRSISEAVRVGLLETSGYSVTGEFVPSKPFACREWIDLVNRL